MIPTSRSVTSSASRRLFCLAFFRASGSILFMQPSALSESVRRRLHCGRTSTPNQAMQLTAVSPAFNFCDDFIASTAGDVLPHRCS